MKECAQLGACFRGHVILDTRIYMEYSDGRQCGPHRAPEEEWRVSDVEA